MRNSLPQPGAVPPGPLTLYRVIFKSYDGTPFMLHTTDPVKIGPWLAEMFGMFPWRSSSPTSVDIQTSSLGVS